MRRDLGSAVVAALLVAACAAPGSDGTGLGSGWKSGVVTQVGSAASFGPLEPGDCRKRVDEDGRSGRRFAAVQYFSGRHAHARILPVPDGLDLAEGDAVVLKVGSCDVAVAR